MSNDTFIREVNEEMRQERMGAIWSRFGVLIVALAALAVLATVGFVIWQRVEAASAAADGDRYYAAVDLAEAGDAAGAQEAFEALAADGVGAYPELARLRLASALAEGGDRPGAVRVLDEVTSSSAPEPIRDIAAVRAGYLLVDDGSPDDVRARVERLTGDSEPMRHPAREALGLALWRSGDAEGARGFFQQITEDLSAPQGLSQRARLMVELIDGGTAYTAMPEAPATEPTSVPDAPAPAAPTDSSVPAPAGGPVDIPPADAEDALSTPLAEQLDLPAAVEDDSATPAETGAPVPNPAEPARGGAAEPRP